MIPSNNEIFPNFEDLVYSSGAHSVNIQSIAYVRQTLSAGRVAAIVCEDLDEHISLLPIVPYAVSLSLRVFYRDLRLSKATIFRISSRRLCKRWTGFMNRCCHHKYLERTRDTQTLDSLYPYPSPYLKIHQAYGNKSD
ncbi:hypothetical protein SLS57_006741 [Botryosphaeria dothidea]